MFSIKNLSVELSGKRVLNGTVSFTIKPGEVVALLGANGSGKSTLIRSILGLVRKSAGAIFYKNQDTDLFPPKLKAQTFAYVPQNTVFQSAYTVIESVVMGRYPHIKQFGHYGKDDSAIAASSLECVGLSGFESRIVTTLSGGETARVAFARALAQDTPVLLLDEPMSALDPKHAIDMMALIRKLADEGRMDFTAMHDINLALNYTDRVIFLKSGGLYGDIKTTNIDEKTLEGVFDISWEIWSTGDGKKLVAIPGK
ncbi:MAG: ABC transporter ATP-binding protein [Synergistaceae bacterium]|nr:ABC transporter ATP-binding protein [Synergistaceae bacterium]